jgi:signal transduction histidine kinase
VRIDSLKAIAASENEDTNRVKALNDLAYEFRGNDPQQSLTFGEEALELARKLHWKKGEATGLKNIGITNRYLSNYPEALENLKKSLEISEEINDKFLIKTCYGNMGLVYDNMSELIKALEYLQKSLKISEELGDKTSIALDLGNIGIVYFELSDYPKGLEYKEKALRIFEELGDKPRIAKCLINIGATYTSIYDYSKALEYEQKALNLCEELGDKHSAANCLFNIGINYLSLNDYVKAINYCERSLKMFEDMGDKLFISRNLSTIAQIYKDQFLYPKAFEYQSRALKIAEEIGANREVAIDLYNIAELFNLMYDYPKALEYNEKALSMAREIGLLETERGTLLNISGIYEKIGQPAKALEYYRKSVTIKDSIVNDENTKKLVQIQMQYEFDKKESLEKAEQAKKDALALKELQKQKLIKRGYAGGFSMLLVIAVIISIMRAQSQKIRLIEKERNRISRELHDDIGAELARITMLSQHMQKKTEKDAEMEERIRRISEAGKKVLGSIGEIIWTMNPQKDNLESLIAYIRRFATEYLETNGIEVMLEFPDEIPAKPISDEYRRNVFLVVKEAIYNITKHSRATMVRLSMNLRKRSAEVEISDNGAGFSVEEKKQWGNGLTNMNQRMKDIGGSFLINSVKDRGTTITLTFPVR